MAELFCDEPLHKVFHCATEIDYPGDDMKVKKF
jgi:hypothetical protein